MSETVDEAAKAALIAAAVEALRAAQSAMHEYRLALERAQAAGATYAELARAKRRAVARQKRP